MAILAVMKFYALFILAICLLASACSPKTSARAQEASPREDAVDTSIPVNAIENELLIQLDSVTPDDLVAQNQEIGLELKELAVPALYIGLFTYDTTKKSPSEIIAYMSEQEGVGQVQFNKTLDQRD